MVAGCGSGSHPEQRSSSSSASAPLAAGRQQRPLPPALARLQAAIVGNLRKAGPNSGAAVYDLTGRRSLLALRDRTPRPPASVEKLYTTVAVLRKLGPSSRLRTMVLGRGH